MRLMRARTRLLWEVASCAVIGRPMTIKRPRDIRSPKTDLSRPTTWRRQHDNFVLIDLGTDSDTGHTTPRHRAVDTLGMALRARRADPLARVDGCTAAMRMAAATYRQAVEHIEAGRGMGPMPWASDRVQEHRRGDGLGVELMAQERALSAADWHRRGVQAMGLAAAGVVDWVVIAGRSLGEYDATRRWRKGSARMQLFGALGRLTTAYGYD